MEAESLITKESLSKIDNYDQFFKLCQEISILGASKLFELFFPIALHYELDGASSVAAMLLVEFDPKVPRPCKELLLEIGDSKWYLSDKFVPFYLVTQFGKHNLLDEIKDALTSNSLTTEQRTRIKGIEYWASMPAVSLAGDFVYFEWQEAIERSRGKILDI